MILESKVANVLKHKRERNVYAVNADDTVYIALQIMARHDLGALLVVERGKIVGIVGERDYARKVALSGRSSRLTQVREIMQSEVLYVDPEDPIEDCLTLMTEKRIRHLPVVEADQVVGLVSIGDVVKHVISDQGHLINDLVRYITGTNLSEPSFDPPSGQGVRERVGRELQVQYQVSAE